MYRLFVSCWIVAWLPATARAEETIDTRPLALTVEPTFQNLKVIRPIIVTHAGDGSDRVFVASQLGKVHVFPNNPPLHNSAGDRSEIFLDISKRVVYKDQENEEGFLGMAFHPKYKQNGEFFVYYNSTDKPHTCILSRFRVSKDNPNRADPAFEEEILRIPQPFWNHNGGTICFGPDGYLYVGLGDGGDANDPFGNGQNLETLLGDILRIDIDRQDAGLKYAIPKDNPFVGRPKARGEIWACGVRNIWRMAFDRKTGVLWAGDVGQNLWEEIDIIVKGGNYGWNLREGKHPFGPKGVEARPDLIEPIWEYHHDIGKSITGGLVYRGKQFPELEGGYLYGDYVTGRIWALWYDFDKKQVTANRPIAGNQFPIMTFGDDEAGEVYFTRPEGTILKFKKGGKSG